MSVLLVEVLLLYPAVFAVFNFKLLGNIKFPIKTNFDNAWSKLPNIFQYQY